MTWGDNYAEIGNFSHFIHFLSTIFYSKNVLEHFICYNPKRVFPLFSGEKMSFPPIWIIKSKQISSSDFIIWTPQKKGVFLAFFFQIIRSEYPHTLLLCKNSRKNIIKLYNWNCISTNIELVCNLSPPDFFRVNRLDSP